MDSANSHEAQFSYASVDKAEADRGDAIVPEQASSSAIWESDAKGPGRTLAATLKLLSVVKKARTHTARAFPGGEQCRGKAKHGKITKVALGQQLAQKRWVG
jgi:hypothetical protein